MKTAEIAIIGGGIAGLVAAATLARRGLQPRLFEAAPELGGRARTRVVDGFHFNQGPHALYVKGALYRELASLGLSVPGGAPRVRNGLAVWNGEIHPLPVGPASAESVPPLSPAETTCLRETFARIAEGDYGGQGIPLRAFTAALPQAVRAVVEAFVSLSNYARAPADIDCKAALDQLRLSFAGALYVDGGWGTLISKLAAAASAAGAILRPGHRIVAVRRDRQAWQIELAGHAPETFEAIILAVAPALAHELVGRSAHISTAANVAEPLRAMCLDLGLSDSGSGAEFALGMDAPTYMSLHSAVAALAPPRAGLLHLSRYLAPGEAPNAAHFEELENFADLLRPGWRAHLAHKQRLAGIAIVHDYPRWKRGGLRTPVVVPDSPGIFLAGDWVGDEGMLSDAAAASAVVAAREATAFLAGVPA